MFIKVTEIRRKFKQHVKNSNPYSKISCEKEKSCYNNVDATKISITADDF